MPLQTCRVPRRAISISRKLVTVSSFIEKPCLHGPGRHPFRDLSGSGGLPSIICRRLRYIFAPGPKKSSSHSIPFCPVVPPWSRAPSVNGDIIIWLRWPHIWILPVIGSAVVVAVSGLVNLLWPRGPTVGPLRQRRLATAPKICRWARRLSPVADVAARLPHRSISRARPYAERCQARVAPRNL